MTHKMGDYCPVFLPLGLAFDNYIVMVLFGRIETMFLLHCKFYIDIMTMLSGVLTMGCTYLSKDILGSVQNEKISNLWLEGC